VNETTYVLKSDYYSQQEALHAALDELEIEGDKVHKFLFGNGEPGIDEKLRQILEYINEQKQKQKEAWSDAKKFALGALLFVVNTLLAIGIARMIP